LSASEQVLPDSDIYHLIEYSKCNLELKEKCTSVPGYLGLTMPEHDQVEISLKENFIKICSDITLDIVSPISDPLQVEHF